MWRDFRPHPWISINPDRTQGDMRKVVIGL
jgi:hypothetical protein